MPRAREPQIGLGRAIRYLRTEMPISQEDLALKSDLHPTWVSHIESGRINPTWGSVRRLATGLRVSLPELASLAEDLEARARPAGRKVDSEAA